MGGDEGGGLQAAAACRHGVPYLLLPANHVLLPPHFSPLIPAPPPFSALPAHAPLLPERCSSQCLPPYGPDSVGVRLRSRLQCQAEGPGVCVY